MTDFRTPAPLHQTPPGPDAGQREVATLFENGAGATAIIAADQFLTIGALRAAPEDVVVVGFDDLHWADLLRRPVTAGHPVPLRRNLSPKGGNE